MANIVRYDARTGRRLEEGESTTDFLGNTYIQGQEWNPSSNNKVMGASDTSDYNPLDIIGAGPNAGMTYEEVEARDLKYEQETGRSYVEDLIGPEDYSGGIQPGETREEAIARISNRPFTMAGQTNTSQYLSARDSESLKNKYGLKGFDYSFAGMTKSQAEAKAKQLSDKKKAGVSQLTTYTYNPETIAGTKKASDNFILALNKINNDNWNSGGTKTDNLNTQLSVTANELGKNWASSADFLKDFTTNPDVQKNLDAYLKAGGTKEKIIEAINKNIVDTTGGDQTGMKTTDQFLADMTPEELKIRQKVVNDLIPEMNLAQDEIARNYNIAEDIKSLYFGTPESVGIYEKIKIQAEEDKRIAEEKEKDEANSLRDMAEYQMQKNEADVKIAKATIEKNRLSAKNYMTGMLAKLGALNTTSSAVVAITNLDQKYQEQASKLDSDLSYANRGIELKLNDAINALERNTDIEINNIEKDLTKTQAEIDKQIMKAQQDADKKSYDIQIKYAALIRTKTAEYTKQAKAQAEKYAKDYAKIASTGFDIGAITNTLYDAKGGDQYISGKIIKSKDGKKYGISQGDGSVKELNLTSSEYNQILRAKLNDEDSINYFLTLPAGFKTYWQSIITGSNKNYSIDDLQTAYEAYKKESEKKTSTRER
jgi:hypothetical protein